MTEQELHKEINNNQASHNEARTLLGDKVYKLLLPIMDIWGIAIHMLNCNQKDFKLNADLKKLQQEAAKLSVEPKAE